MSSSFITRIEREKEEPYIVIFTTDDHDKYRHIEDECRKMIGHAKPTVDDAIKTVQNWPKWKQEEYNTYFVTAGGADDDQR